MYYITMKTSKGVIKMWEKIFNLAISNGIWAVLFLVLLFFQLKDSKKREEKYQKTIETLGASLKVVTEIKEDVEDIKIELKKLKPTEEGLEHE